jgi:signal transduction histidine kinase
MSLAERLADRLPEPGESARDVVLACGLAVLVLAAAQTATIPADGHGLSPTGAILLLAETLPLAVRHRYPVQVLAITGIATIVYGAMGEPATGAEFGVLIAMYTVASVADWRTSIICLAVTLMGIQATFVVILLRSPTTLPVYIISYGKTAGLFVAAWLVGESIRSRRERAAELEHRAEELERARDDEARQAVIDERQRIARELHDVVAHNVSVMVVQAGGARRVLETKPELAMEALAAIESTGREALGEMRRMLDVLRTDDTVDGLAPQPSLSRLDGLVDHVREAGVVVELMVQGEARSLPVAIDLTAFRIVQEALTNVVKHAGRARATVRIAYEPGSVAIEVADDGRGAARSTFPSDPGRRHGIIGMRERVALFGGELSIGPRMEGGFVVRARLPIDPAPG